MLDNRVFAMVFLAITMPIVAQTGGSRSTLERSLGFEDQSNETLTGWFANPRETVSADDRVFHSGRWSVRLQRDPQSAGTYSVITRSLPLDFQGGVIELRGYLRLQDVSGSAGLWLGEDADGKMLTLENMEAQQVTGTRGWAAYHIRLPIDRQAKQVNFGVLVTGTGTLWADDLELLVDGKPIAGMPVAEASLTESVDNLRAGPGSGIALKSLTPVQVSNLVTLARVWGFLKYHHPAITSGQRQWDYDLFRVLPAVLAASDRPHANEAMMNWVDALGPVAPCSSCVSGPMGDLDIKPVLDWIHERAILGDRLSERLESIYANRTGKQFYVTARPTFDHELPYETIAFPDSGYQLLALFRWWNIMQYWAPDRDVAGQDWTAVLADFIPKLALAKDKTDYQLTLLELIAKANDTHANLWSSMTLRPPVGDCALPVVLRFVGETFVVYRVDAANSGFQLGDVLEELDKRSVQFLVSTWAVYYDDSNDAARKRDFAANLTRGACGPVSAKVTRNGRSVVIAAIRVQSRFETYFPHDESGETFRLLSPEIAYVKLSSIKAADLSAYFEKAKNTKGLIVDIRNYPAEFVPFKIGAYLVTKPTPFVTYTYRDIANPGAFRFGGTPLIQPGPVHYGGKVVILVDEVTQSQAEYTAMALRATPNGTVVGSTTAGADGNFSPIPLPGGVATGISGLGIFYPDHRPTQRLGIVPDIVVRPTVQGIAARRDEVLETAVHVIEGPQ